MTLNLIASNYKLSASPLQITVAYYSEDGESTKEFKQINYNQWVCFYTCSGGNRTQEMVKGTQKQILIKLLKELL